MRFTPEKEERRFCYDDRLMPKEIIRGKMFKLHRGGGGHGSDKSGEKIDFKFFNFHADKVPKGWDRLLVSIVSVETGKTVTKSTKASAKHGSCQWTESLSESIWMSQENNPKEMEDRLYKIVLSMGSTRSGILGEAIINLTNYMNTRTAVPVSLPLKKCSHGTVLQVKIQCLNPRRTTGDEQCQEVNSQSEVTNLNPDEIDNKSDISDNSYEKSGGSSSSVHLGSNSQPGQLGSRNTSFSASGSRHSSDSAEGSIVRTIFSPRNNLNGDLYSPTARQDPYGVGQVEDHSQSNRSSFNSKLTNSGNNLQNQRQESGQNSSALRHVSSSKDLLEAAEDTIEELRAEAKMWERNARKLMFDLETVKKEFADKSRHEEDLDMELSAAHIERNGLKQEITQLKDMLEESKLKHTAAESSISQAEGINNIQKELNSEMKFLKESNTNLALQLEKTQESNIELVSILQELEEIIEKQRLEIENLSSEKAQHESPMAEENENFQLKLQELQESQAELQATVRSLEKALDDKSQKIKIEQNLKQQALLEIEMIWKPQLSKKEEEIFKLDGKLSDLLSGQGSHEMTYEDGSDSNLIKEIEVLKEKVQELECDCNELTEENLDLAFKLKESKKNLLSRGSSFGSTVTDLQGTVSSTALESEVEFLRSQINQLKEKLRKKEILCEGVTTDRLQEQFINLQNKISSLELQLQSSQDKACNLDAQLHSSHVEVLDREKKITTLKQQLQIYQGRETNSDHEDSHGSPRYERPGSQSSVDTSRIFPELYKQLHMALTHVKNPWYNGSSDTDTQWESSRDDLVVSDGAAMVTHEEQAEAILNDVYELNKLLEVKISECQNVLQCNEAELRERDADFIEAQQKLEDYWMDGSSSKKEPEILGMELEAKVDLSKELEMKKSEVEELEAILSLKEEEIEIVRSSQTELECQVSALLKEKGQLREKLEILSRDDVRSDLNVLSSNLDSHVSDNKMLERQSAELESGRHELELHLSQLEEENVQLSERISGLEAQLRYLTDEKESRRLELENSKSVATDLRGEIERLAVDMDMQKTDMKQKLHDMQKRWSEAQEECEYLKKANPKLQATAESLIEECATAQRLNAELRKQKLELHERCTHLEAELRDSQTSFSDCCKKVELLESKLSRMQEDIDSRTKHLNSELDILLHENKELKGKIDAEESLLNQMYLEKTMEVEDLQREVAHLTEQISSTRDERGTLVSNSLLEVSTLRADKAKLESALQQAQAKVKISDTALHTLQLESRNKVEVLIKDLAAYKTIQELLTVDHEKLQRLFDEVKSSEERYKGTVHGLELKLTDSEYEKQQLVEEIDTLKVQLQKIAQLQEEILDLKNSLNEVKFEKSKLEASFQLLSGDCEELQAEKTSCLEKISIMQKLVSELEDCKFARMSLEEKLLRLEGDLTAKEALCAQHAELKNELNRMKRSNSQFQWKIQSIEAEKEKLMKKVQSLEEELDSKKEEKQHHSKSITKDLPKFESKTHEEVKHSENEMERKNRSQSLKVNRSRNRSDEKLFENDQHRRKGDNNHADDTGKPQTLGVDLAAKIMFLENELAEAKEANNMYKLQLKKLLSDGQDGNVSASESEELSNGGWEGKVLVLESELKDIRERYFQMSLKFAEVEAQREELVMRFKALKNGKRWFSSK